MKRLKECGVPPVRICSCTNNLVCGLIRTKDAHATCKGTQFPIRINPKTWNDNWEKDLKGVEPAAQLIIKDLQPCFRMPSSPEDDHLNVLNVICNSDRRSRPETRRGQCRYVSGRNER